MAATACIRGVSAREIDVRVISPEQYVEEAQSSSVDAEMQRFERRSQALATIGLEELQTYAEVLQAYVDTIGAYYSTVTDSITLFDWGEGVSVEMLVHECAHALQFRNDPAEDAAGETLTLDESLARGAMFEGDVTLTTDRAAMLVFGADPAEPNWPRIYGKWTQLTRGDYWNEALPVTLAGRYFYYAFGTAFLQPVLSEKGQRGVDSWVTEPPRSVRAIFAGASKARNTDRHMAAAYDGDVWSAPEASNGRADAGEEAALQEAGLQDAGLQEAGFSQPRPFTSGRPLLAPSLPGLELVALDSLGAFVFESFARRQPRVRGRADVVQERLKSGADYLEADHLSLWYEPETKSSVAVYRLRFTEPRVRDAWLDARTNPHAQGEMRAALVDGDVVLIASADSKWLSSLDVAALTWQAFDAASVPSELRAAPSFMAGQRVQSGRVLRSPL
jgi:hypothetical protein